MDKSTTSDFVSAAELVLAGRAALETVDGVPGWPSPDRDDLPRFILLADVKPSGFIVLLGPDTGRLSCHGAYCADLLDDDCRREAERAGVAGVEAGLRSFQAAVWKAYTSRDPEALFAVADVVPGVEGVSLLAFLRPHFAAADRERPN